MQTTLERNDPPAAPDPRDAVLEERAFRSRTVLLFGTIDERSARDAVQRLMALDCGIVSRVVERSGQMSTG